MASLAAVEPDSISGAKDNQCLAEYGRLAHVGARLGFADRRNQKEEEEVGQFGYSSLPPVRKPHLPSALPAVPSP